jgi:hypothetical protein
MQKSNWELKAIDMDALAHAKYCPGQQVKRPHVILSRQFCGLHEVVAAAVWFCAHASGAAHSLDETSCCLCCPPRVT